MNITSLYNTRIGSTIYIVGSGPSLRFFPKNYFFDKITIGLNQVWKVIPQKHLNYLLTIHPETLPACKENTTVITKVKGKITGEEPYYFFRNNKDVKDFSYASTSDDTLYVGRGIHTAAMCLAAKMGARFVHLVGCDMGTLVGNQHHALEQNVQFHGIRSSEVYLEYYYNARHLRTYLKQHFNVDFLSVWPFLGKYLSEDMEYLLKEYDLPRFDNPSDTSTYERKNLDFKN